MTTGSALYPGGLDGILQRLDKREAPFLDAWLEIPAADADLELQLAARVPPLADGEDSSRDRRSIRRKWAALRREFEGQPELFARNALMIAILRRRTPPEDARAAFVRIWKEAGKPLAEGLSTRWLISSAATFADHGATESQRMADQGFYLLFDLIKLHDSERRVSGKPLDRGFAWRRSREMDDLAFGLPSYSLAQGDLDLNLLARLARLADADPVFRPLGRRMLELVLNDPKTVFGRIQRYKRRAATDDRA